MEDLKPIQPTMLLDIKNLGIITELWIKLIHNHIHSTDIKFIISLTENDGLLSKTNDGKGIADMNIERLTFNDLFLKMKISKEGVDHIAYKSSINLDFSDNIHFGESLDRIFELFICSKLFGQTMIIDNSLNKMVNKKTTENEAIIITMFNIFDRALESNLDKNFNWVNLYNGTFSTIFPEANNKMKDIIPNIGGEEVFNWWFSNKREINEIKEFLKQDNSDEKKEKFLQDTFLYCPSDDLSYPTPLLDIRLHAAALLLGGVTTGLCFAFPKPLQETILQTPLAKVLLGISVFAVIEIGIVAAELIKAYSHKKSLEQNIPQPI